MRWLKMHNSQRLEDHALDEANHHKLEELSNSDQKSGPQTKHEHPQVAYDRKVVLPVVFALCLAIFLTALVSPPCTKNSFHRTTLTDMPKGSNHHRRHYSSDLK